MKKTLGIIAAIIIVSTSAIAQDEVIIAEQPSALRNAISATASVPGRFLGGVLKVIEVVGGIPLKALDKLMELTNVEFEVGTWRVYADGRKEWKMFRVHGLSPAQILADRGEQLKPVDPE